MVDTCFLPYSDNIPRHGYHNNMEHKQTGPTFREKRYGCKCNLRHKFK